MAIWSNETLCVGLMLLHILLYGKQVFKLMVKTKAKRTGKVPVKESETSHCLIDSPDCDNQNEGGEWIIVKKQRVTIWVPAAPLSERCLSANQGLGDAHLMPPETASNHMQLPVEKCMAHPSGNEPEKTTLLAAPPEIQVVRSASPPVSKDQRIESQDPHEVSLLKSHKLLGLSNTLKAVKQPRSSLAPRRPLNLTISLSQGLRASNLERKLERAGGLSQWLTSLGLGQFVRILQGKCLNKYQLVNLTMEKLKDMGANAVGPRRKLIHAIDCVCQPYCFQAI